MDMYIYIYIYVYQLVYGDMKEKEIQFFFLSFSDFYLFELISLLMY